MNYAIGLALALSDKLHEDEHLTLYVSDEIAASLEAIKRDNVTKVRVLTPTNVKSRLLADHIRAPLWALRDRLDVMHYPKGHIPIVKPPGLKIVATIHDDIALRYRAGEFEGNRSLRWRYFAWASNRALAKANGLLFDTQWIAERLGCSSSHEGPLTAVVGMGVSLPKIPRVGVAAKKDQVLHFGSPLPHKRSAKVLAWTQRKLAERSDGIELLVTGELTEDAEALCDTPGIRRVHDVLTTGEVAGLLAESRALIYSSIAEGFGLPPVEAMVTGTPAVWPKVGPMTEVLGGIPGSYKPNSYKGFSAALDEVLAMSDAQILSARLEITSRHSWSRTAELTLEFYRAVAASPSVRALRTFSRP